MKKILFVLLASVLLFGCVGTPQIPADLCSEYNPETSLLLKVSVEKGIPLNEVYYGLLDIVQIGLIVEAIDRENARNFMNDLAEWYNDNYPVSYTTLLNYMTDEAVKVQGVSAIISRRVGYYQSNLAISQYDNCLIKAGWNDAMNQLYLR